MPESSLKANNAELIDACFALFSPFEDLRAEKREANEIHWDEVYAKLSEEEAAPLNQISAIASGNLINALDRIYAMGSRRILRRHRIRKHVSKVKEIDARAMMTNIMLPGRNLAEKAGVKQELWCIDRYESFDTAENKIAKKILKTLRDKTKEYLKKHGEKECSRVKRVRALNRMVKLFLAPDGYFSDSRVKEVKTIGDPNYVLKYDPDYHEIWKAYELMKDSFTEKIKNLKDELLFEAVMCYARGFIESAIPKKYACYDLYYEPVNIIKKISEYDKKFHNPERLRGLWITEAGKEIRFYASDAKEIIFQCADVVMTKINSYWDGNDSSRIKINGKESECSWQDSKDSLKGAMEATIEIIEK